MFNFTKKRGAAGVVKKLSVLAASVAMAVSAIHPVWTFAQEVETKVSSTYNAEDQFDHKEYTHEEFINFIGMKAVEDYENHKILPSVTIAQAIKESGWGTSELAQNANALFGIKKHDWTGKTYTKIAYEHNPDGSEYVVENTLWRAYDSWTQSISDHGEYLCTRKLSDGSLRYASVIGETDAYKACINIHKAGYATSPTYGESLYNDYVVKYNLRVYDEMVLNQNGLYTDSAGNTFLYSNGSFIKEQEAFINGNWVYFDENGHMVKGAEVYLKDLDKWTRYDENGCMVKGEYLGKDLEWYYYDDITGAKQFGLYLAHNAMGDIWYYLDEETGIMMFDTFVKNGKVYNFGHDGFGKDMMWVEEEDGTFWYEKGQRQGCDIDDPYYRGKEIYDPEADRWFWLDNVSMGSKAVSKDVYQDSLADSEGNCGKWVRYDENGYMVKGWDILEDGREYYFDEIYGTMAKGNVVIDGIEYYFNEITGIRE